MKHMLLIGPKSQFDVIFSIYFFQATMKLQSTCCQKELMLTPYVKMVNHRYSVLLSREMKE
jgi:hypothetical protein